MKPKRLKLWKTMGLLGGALVSRLSLGISSNREGVCAFKRGFHSWRSSNREGVYAFKRGFRSWRFPLRALVPEPSATQQTAYSIIPLPHILFRLDPSPKLERDQAQQEILRGRLWFRAL